MGVILYFMCYGKYPFEGKNDSDIVQKIGNYHPEFPPQPVVSNSCKILIRGMLEKLQCLRINLNSAKFDRWFREEE